MANPFSEIAPALAGYRDKVLFGGVWKRPDLPARDWSLVTVTCLVALYRINELPFHLKRAGERRHPIGTDRGDHAPRVLPSTALPIVKRVLEEAGASGMPRSPMVTKAWAPSVGRAR